jgi:hypothetical protein
MTNLHKTRLQFVGILFLTTFYFKPNFKMNQAENKVDLSGQKLKSIPNWVFKKTNLTELYLGSKTVTFYPPLSSMVNTDANELKELPEKIGELANLKILVLNTNKLKTLPSSIIKLTKLEVLDLSINKDLDIIEELDKISKLPNLKVLKIVDVTLRKSDIGFLKKSLPINTKIILTVQEYFEIDSKKNKEIQDSIANKIKEINKEILKNTPYKIKD